MMKFEELKQFSNRNFSSCFPKVLLNWGHHMWNSPGCFHEHFWKISSFSCPEGPLNFISAWILWIPFQATGYLNIAELPYNMWFVLIIRSPEYCDSWFTNHFFKRMKKKSSVNLVLSSFCSLYFCKDIHTHSPMSPGQ